jgi:DNA-binding CsgD family transcriptional regulator
MIAEPNRPADKTWDGAVAALFAHLGTERFADALRQAISQCCAFDSMVVTQYPGASQPVSLYQDLDDVQAAISVQFYASGPYLLDPIYQACRGGIEPGAYRLLELASEAFFRSEYYRTFYRKIRISDEMGILIRQNDRDWIVISLARVARRRRFSQDDVTRINAVFQTLSAAVLRHWSAAEKIASASDGGMLEDRLESFASDVLTPREAEIVRLVLQGHSTPSAAAFLDISEGTVKVHRHHAYTKLGISSQAELFSLATRHFAAGQG